MIKQKTLLILLAAVAATATLSANPPGPADNQPPCKGEYCPKHDGMRMGGMGHHMIFDQIDTNKDGNLNRDEWMAHYKEMDTDNNGMLTQSEMDKFHQSMMEKKHEEMHKKMQEQKK